MRRKPASLTNTADPTAPTIAVPEHATLQPADHEAFAAGLDTPPAPTDRLRAAFARHRETITSR